LNKPEPQISELGMSELASRTLERPQKEIIEGLERCVIELHCSRKILLGEIGELFVYILVGARTD